MELLPTIDALHWCADAGPKILADEKIRLPAGVPAHQAKPLLLRADRRRRRDRALELPLVDPLRRGRDRADGRQRRRPQAGQPDAAARRGGSAQSSRRRACPRACVRTVHGGGAVGDALAKSTRREDLLHRLGRGRPQGRRGLRRAAEGLGARARRQGPDDRLRRRRPRQRDLRRGLGRLRQRRPDLLGDRARLRRCARSPSRFVEGVVRERRGAARSATRSTGRPRSAR